MSMIESLPDAETSAPVTLCPPGKRSREVMLRAPVESPIPITTATALRWPEKPRLVPPAANDRRPAQERVEAAQRAEALSVALAQPHRAGSDDPRLAFPLGRLCARFWPRDEDFGNAMHAAGVSYADEVRAAKVARGFHVAGCASDQPMAGGPVAEPTMGEVEDARAKVEAAERTLAKADEVLRSVMPPAPRAMVRLAFDLEEPSPYDDDVIKHGLYLLALHYGHLERPRHRA